MNEAAIRADFRNFLYLMWKWLRLPDPTPVQYDIAHYLQHGPNRQMVEAFRGVGKSWITAAFVLWRLYCNANERVLVVSASKDRADSFSTFVKRCINEWELLEDLRVVGALRDSNVAFDVGGSMPHQSPSVRSIGITGQMTGGRASVIVADDIETPKNSQTQVQRERLAELVKEFDAIRMADKDLKPLGLNEGRIVYLGTPQCEMSLYNELPERGYEVRIWPARVPADADRYKGRLAPLVTASGLPAGAPMEPTRFGELDLRGREASYGRSGFALQFQLDTSLSDQNRFPLKLADAMVMGLSPEMAPVKTVWGSGPDCLAGENVPIVGLAGERWHRPMYISREPTTGATMYAPYQGCIMFIDPSGRGADETGYAVVAMLNGTLYVLACGGFKDGYTDDTLQGLANIAKRFKVTRVLIESNFGDGMFDKLLRPFLQRTHPCTTEEVRSSIQKEKRIIDTLEPVFNQHLIVFDEELVRKDFEEPDPQYQLFHQITRITREKGALAHDDRVDPLAGAVAWWVTYLGKDQEHAEEERRDQLLKKDLEDWFGHVLGGGSSSSTNWNGSLSEGML